jgi:REP element-mobilizing transposase RayT
VLIYLLAEAAARFGVMVHAVMVMSNHWHLVVTDVRGNYPAFLCHLHKLVAKSLNAHWGRWENFWASEQTSVVELTDAAAVLDKVAYTLANPVSAGLVAQVADWPGASSWRALDGRKVRVRRPGWYFDEKGTMPEVAEVRFEVPPVFERMSRSAWAKLVRAEVAKRERVAARERRETGTVVAGFDVVMSQSAFDAPSTSAPRRGLRPRIAGHNKWRRIEALQRNRRWLEAYRAAYRQLRAGFLDVAFPSGTYELFRLGLVACHAL